MNLLALCGWKRWWAERRQHAETKAAYDSLVIAHHRALAELASESCRDCDTLADHVDVLEKDNARLEAERDAEALRVDAMAKTLFWLEQRMGVGSG